jgi:DNA-binding transcriptional regulator YiaG
MNKKTTQDYSHSEFLRKKWGMTKKYKNKMWQYRAKLKMTQKDFGKLFNVTHGTIAHWESAKAVSPPPYNKLVIFKQVMQHHGIKVSIDAIQKDYLK